MELFWTQYRTDLPHLDSLLDKESLTLRELLEEEECLFQGLKQPSKKLIDFLTREDILQELVSLVTEEPSAGLNEKERYRLPNLACETLNFPIAEVSKKLSEEIYLTKLFSVLDSEPPLNPLIASLFGRTISVLVLKQDQRCCPYQYTCLQVLEFLKSHNDRLNLLVKHFGTSSIMELTLTLLNGIEGRELQNKLADLVQSERLVEKILSLFDSRLDEEIHYSASYFLRETIENYKKSTDSVYENKVMEYIYHSLLTSSVVTNLFENVFKNELCESNIIGCVDVLLSIIKVPPSKLMKKIIVANSEMASGSEKTGCKFSDERSAILCSIVPFLPRLHAVLLTDPPKCKPQLPTSPIKPFGKTRLTIANFIANLVSANNPEINSALIELKTIGLLLDMFFKYPSNNFLHTQVVNLVTCAIDCTHESQESALLVNIFVDCDLLTWILNGWKQFMSLKASGQSRQHAYMGHIINLSNNILLKSQSGTLKSIFADLIYADTLMAWEDFVTTELISINTINARCLGGKHPSNDRETSKDDPMEVEENPAEEESIFTQACSLKRSSLKGSSQSEESYLTTDSDSDDDGEGQESLWMDCSEPYSKE